MSADRITVCPVCKAKADAELNTAYGKVSAKEFAKLQQQLYKDLVEELRENWNIGLDEEGKFSITYSALCW